MKLGNVGRTLHVGIVGLGSRSGDYFNLLLEMDDIVIDSVCDVYQDRVEQAQDRIEKARGYRPMGTLDYHEVTAMEGTEAVLIISSWQTHIPVAVDAIRHGKIPGMEVGGATSLDECWLLVRESERCNVPVMLLENCCYNREEMALLNMIRQGVFGEMVHCRGGYQHDLREEIGMGDVNRHYRLDNFMNRNAELYPTHELGPIACYLRLNRGNRMTKLVSMSSKAVGEHAWLQEHRPDAPHANAKFNEGDVVTTMISCANGETIMLTHDCTLARPYSRGGYVQGTRGVWAEDGRLIYLEGSTQPTEHGAHVFESDKAYMDKYMHPLWKDYNEFGLKNGHGGMDYLVLRAFIECVQEHKPFPIDVYDAAAWMSITCLSEESIALGSAPVAIPDFTSGKWMKREKRPADIFSLDEVYPDVF